MFSLDNQGSSNRGLEFENVTFRRLGMEEGKDQVEGVSSLLLFPMWIATGSVYTDGASEDI